MDIYHAWCDLKSGVSDTAFAAKVHSYMGHLKAEGLIEGWRLTRRKLRLGVDGIGEFHLMMEIRDLAQLESAFARVASRRSPVESFHAAVNSLVVNAKFALYRDFPDSFRHMGEEKF